MVKRKGATSALRSETSRVSRTRSHTLHSRTTSRDWPILGSQNKQYGTRFDPEGNKTTSIYSEGARTDPLAIRQIVENGESAHSIGFTHSSTCRNILSQTKSSMGFNNKPKPAGCVNRAGPGGVFLEKRPSSIIWCVRVRDFERATERIPAQQRHTLAIRRPTYHPTFELHYRW